MFWVRVSQIMHPSETDSSAPRVCSGGFRFGVSIRVGGALPRGERQQEGRGGNGNNIESAGIVLSSAAGLNVSDAAAWSANRVPTTDDSNSVSSAFP